MRKRYALVLFLAPLLVSQPSRAQGIMEGGGVQGMAAGLGAGMAASVNHGNLVRRTYGAAVSAEQAALAQSQAIQQYVKVGCQYEAKKEWEYAQKSFSYALQIVAMRDGPGSPKSVPILRHLVSVSKGQQDLGQAISYQRTVYTFAQAGKINEPGTAFKEEANLAGLYIQKEDYESAEPLLRDYVKKAGTNPAVTADAQRNTRRTYADVLRKLHKDIEAEAIEAMDREAADPVAQTKTAPPASAARPSQSPATRAASRPVDAPAPTKAAVKTTESPARTEPSTQPTATAEQPVTNTAEPAAVTAAQPTVQTQMGTAAAEPSSKAPEVSTTKPAEQPDQVADPSTSVTAIRPAANIEQPLMNSAVQSSASQTPVPSTASATPQAPSEAATAPASVSTEKPAEPNGSSAQPSTAVSPTTAAAPAEAPAVTTATPSAPPVEPPPTTTTTTTPSASADTPTPHTISATPAGTTNVSPQKDQP